MTNFYFCVYNQIKEVDKYDDTRMGLPIFSCIWSVIFDPYFLLYILMGIRKKAQQ